MVYGGTMKYSSLETMEKQQKVEDSGTSLKCWEKRKEL